MRRCIPLPLTCFWAVLFASGSTTLLLLSLLIQSPTSDQFQQGGFHSTMSPSATNRTPNSHWLVFNAVPYSGGSFIERLLEESSQISGFRHWNHPHRTPWARFLIPDEQRNLASWFEYQHLPISYHRHFFHVNFTALMRYTQQSPIYINIARNPANRLRSIVRHQQNLKQNTGKKKTEEMDLASCVVLGQSDCRIQLQRRNFILSVPFFCGQHPHCVKVNDYRALQAAKENAEMVYSVVGVSEDINMTDTVLQQYIPLFFRNNTRTHDSHGDGKNLVEHGHEEPVPSEMEFRVKKILWAEYELYEFLRHRLSLQYNFITQRHRTVNN